MGHTKSATTVTPQANQAKKHDEKQGNKSNSQGEKCDCVARGSRNRTDEFGR